MNSIKKIGLGDIGIGTCSSPGRTRMTRLVDPSGRGKRVTTRSKHFRSAYDGIGTRKKSAILLGCAAAIIMVSAVAVAAFGTEKSPKVPGHISVPFPLVVYGNTLNSTFDPIPFCHVTITLLRTGSNVTVMSDGGGLYSYDIKDWSPQLNDQVRVDAWNYTSLNGTRAGTNTGTITGSVIPADELQIDVVLLVVPIPEFASIVIPMAGVFSIFAAARVTSNKSKDE